MRAQPTVAAAVVEEPDVNAPFPRPPVSQREYARRLTQAKSRAPWPEKVELDLELELVLQPFATEEDWRRWYFWEGRDLDEWGDLPKPKLPYGDPTDECLTSEQLAEKIGWALDRMEDQNAIGTSGGFYLHEADGWRFYSYPKPVVFKQAAE